MPCVALRVVEQRLQLPALIARHVGEVRLLRRQIAPGIGIDFLLRSAHEAAHRVQHLFLGIQQRICLPGQFSQIEVIRPAGNGLDLG